MCVLPRSSLQCPVDGILKSAVSPWTLLSDSAPRWVSGPPRRTDARVHHLGASARTYKWTPKPLERASWTRTYCYDINTHSTHGSHLIWDSSYQLVGLLMAWNKNIVYLSYPKLCQKAWYFVPCVEFLENRLKGGGHQNWPPNFIC